MIFGCLLKETEGGIVGKWNCGIGAVPFYLLLKKIFVLHHNGALMEL